MKYSFLGSLRSSTPKVSTGGISSTRFLIKAVIYDMPCFIQTTDSNINTPTASVSDGRRDRSNIVTASTSTSTCTTTSEVAQRLGVHNQESEGEGRLEEKQMLMGRGDGVRIKYMDKIRTKKMMAQARGERERFAINTNVNTVAFAPSHKAWQVTPGSSALVHYLEERGISQALIARGDQSLLNELLEELRNYKFQYLRNFELEETEKPTTEVTNSADHYSEILKSFCAIWGLPPWQVLLGIGDDTQDEALYKAIVGSQFFVCKVRNLSYPEDVNSAQKEILSHAGNSKKSNYNPGLINWFRRLSEGTLHEDDVRGRGKHTSKDDVHFKVVDMRQLKWITEDMNGVSYRMSTIVQGFQ